MSLEKLFQNSITARILDILWDNSGEMKASELFRQLGLSEKMPREIYQKEKIKYMMILMELENLNLVSRTLPEHGETTYMFYKGSNSVLASTLNQFITLLKLRQAKLILEDQETMR